MPHRISVVSLLLVASLWGLESVAQELTPRTYWPAPTGTKVLVTGYSYSEGGVIFDPSTPLYNVDSRVNAGLVAYLQTLDLWGRSSNILVELPYAWGETKGLVGETPADTDFSGFADVSVTMTVNLVGAPAMTAKDFLAFRADPKPILGTSLKIVPPTGQLQQSFSLSHHAFLLRAFSTCSVIVIDYDQANVTLSGNHSPGGSYQHANDRGIVVQEVELCRCDRDGAVCVGAIGRS